MAKRKRKINFKIQKDWFRTSEDIRKYIAGRLRSEYDMDSLSEYSIRVTPKMIDDLYRLKDRLGFFEYRIMEIALQYLWSKLDNDEELKKMLFK